MANRTTEETAQVRRRPEMNESRTTVLLVEDDPADAKLIQDALAGTGGHAFRVEWVTRLSDALERLGRDSIEVILLDLTLPDGQGIDAFDRVHQAAPNALILVLSGSTDEEAPRLALQRGAYDYLAKGHIDAHWLPRALRYVTDRKSTELAMRAAEEALFEEKERAQVTLNSIGDAVLTTDLLGNVTYLNLVAETMTGWSRNDALGRPLSEVFRIIDGTTRQAAASPAYRAIEEDKTVGLATDCVLVRRDGFESAIEDSSAPIHDRHGHVTGAVIVFHDVSEARAMAKKMSHQAHHDFLTGLPNRMLLTERLSQAIGQAHRHHKQVALLFLDLDYFKHINDSLGHAIGDELLQSVAGRLVACVRATDTVCRQGGDEFVILLSEIESPQDAAHVADKVLAALTAPQQIGGHELHVTLSIGISVYPEDGTTTETLTQSADTAMYHAKANGRNNFQFFKAEMNIRAVRRQFVEGSLRRALKEDEFLLHYQPQIDLASGAMTGAEALIRWQDPDLGLIYPADFVPIAEECGLIVPIGRWVLREACRQARAWLDSGLIAVPVAVNISALELRHDGFLAGVALILKETGLPARYLELELTESIIMDDADSSAAALCALRNMGVQLAIDDFGTGYSSLSYLKRLPFNTLKIDQSFVRDIATNADGATIVAAVIGMGKNLNQRVIAEGVETHAQLAFLRTQRCEVGQGYQFSHPLPAEAFELLLVSGNHVLVPRQLC
ncbi:response regulator receiver modulated diguanylate cyclase/phosphodiesterase with PAS/PAC sensor(s) [Azoarcus sp. CIB]|uniref:putative bifunctional diguanylate cyclase/phosphodiesterase n=1 Tax=Aromatoleum sp. (strain CIB) TaxID=198107 RepID=UPI0006A2AB75|nr:EAL domain-containing protein [Azoarcus sp. CIB]AKU12144.1 response regulator receiver modulated diguanylate cyclase/phosphodiesterase with PAS/PAC sensor(s) [Azoarcus sp. CIB]